MEDKEINIDTEEQAALELLESIKKMHDREKQLLKDNAFVYFCLWSSFNKPQAAPSPITPPRRVKMYPYPAQKSQ
jgi:hypothetical protein